MYLIWITAHLTTMNTGYEISSPTWCWGLRQGNRDHLWKKKSSKWQELYEQASRICDSCVKAEVSLAAMTRRGQIDPWHPTRKTKFWTDGIENRALWLDGIIVCDIRGQTITGLSNGTRGFIGWQAVGIWLVRSVNDVVVLVKLMDLLWLEPCPMLSLTIAVNSVYFCNSLSWWPLLLAIFTIDLGSNKKKGVLCYSFFVLHWLWMLDSYLMEYA